MPKYKVTLVGLLSEVWEIEATTPEEAIEDVRQGGGTWISNEWSRRPDAEAEEA